MTNSAVEDFEAIRRRQEEIAAERNLALTGSTLPEEPKVGEVAMGWSMTWTGGAGGAGGAADYDPA
jgi:hypothetical protein